MRRPPSIRTGIGPFCLAAVATAMAPVAVGEPGDLVWSTEIVGDAYACPAVASDGTIVIASHTGGGILYAIDPDDGTILRQTQLPGSVEHSVALGDDDTVYFNTVANDIASGDQSRIVAGAWDYETFTEIWRTSLDRGADTSPILGEDRLYLGVVVKPTLGDVVADCAAGDECGHFYSFDIATGDMIIDMWVEGWAATPGVIDDEGHVFFGVEDLTDGVPIEDGLWPGRFYAIDGADPISGTEPTELWTPFDAEGDFGSPVGYAEGVVYTTCRDGHLYGFDAADGTTLFDRELDAPSWTGCTIGRDPDADTLVIYTGTQYNEGATDGSSQLMAIELDGSTAGDLLWSVSVPGGMGFGNPALDDQGNVYAVTSTSVLVVYDRDGSLLWTVGLPGWDDEDVEPQGGIGGPTILEDGTVVCSSNGGYIVAYEGSGSHLADDVPWPKYKHDLRATANTTTPIRHPIAGDVTGDRLVNMTDLTTLLDAWGTDDADADLDASGVVDILDLLEMLHAWTS